MRLSKYYVYRQIMAEHEQTGLVAVASVEEPMSKT